jgi:hypothetical protein
MFKPKVKEPPSLKLEEIFPRDNDVEDEEEEGRV